MKNESNRTPRRSPESGYNLVEVLVAMAMLGTVLIGIVTLFVLGQYNVYSGKQMTKAVAIGTRVLEDFAPLTRDSIERSFGLTGIEGATVTLHGVTYPNAIVRTTKADAGDTAKDVDGYLSTWDEYLQQEDFTDGNISLVIQAVEPDATVSAPYEFQDVPIYRIRVFVEWNERQRERRVELDTVKTDRTI